MQLTPRLTSASASAWVATTRLSFTATTTPHPVPQKRHGAFDHFTLAASGSAAPMTGPGIEMPAAAPAAEAAVCRMKSRRVVVIAEHLVHLFQRFDALID